MRRRSIVDGDVSHTRLPKEKKPEGFVTDMFEPEYFEYVTLRVKRYLLDDMLDDMLEHFRDYASISPYSPVNTRSEYLAEVRKMLGAYPEFNVK